MKDLKVRIIYHSFHNHQLAQNELKLTGKERVAKANKSLHNVNNG